MNRGASYRVVVVSALAVALLAPMCSAQAAGGAADPQLCAARLSELVPDLPSDMDLPKRCTQPELQALLECVAPARTVGGAHLLIRCLAFQSMNFTDTDGEPVVVYRRIPAILLLQKHWGASVGPLVMADAISTDKRWLRVRCALALRVICTAQELTDVRRVFSLDDSQNPSAQDLAKLLDLEDLDLTAEISPEAADHARRIRDDLRRMGEEHMRQKQERERQATQPATQPGPAEPGSRPVEDEPPRDGGR